MPDPLILALLALLTMALVAAGAAFSLWSGAREQQRIRAWADSQAYAIVRMQYRRHFGGLLFWFPLVQRGSWFVEVEDEQGGRRCGWVHFGHWLFETPWGRLSVEWQ